MACYKPITLCRPKAAKFLQVVPCGRCIGCRLERSRQWAVRCFHESQMHENNCFITLTYSDKFLPPGGYIRPTLVPRDLELFWKRFRKECGNGIRYFACGEYGENNFRPHYHACVFGFDFPDKKFLSSSNDNSLYTSDLLSRLWAFGNTVIGDCTFNSAAYVARYIIGKKLGRDSRFYSDHFLEPEFVRMSRRPGIGKSWYDKYKTDVYPHDRVVVRGVKCRPPRYYDLKFAEEFPDDALGLKIDRSISAFAKFSDNTGSRLSVKNTVKLAQLSFLSRSL